MWGFQMIKDMLIKKLDSERSTWKDALCEIMVAHKYEIKSWYLSAYVKLAKRNEPLTFEEAEKLGLSFAMKMTGVRERELSRRAKSSQDALEDLTRAYNSLRSAVSSSTRKNRVDPYSPQHSRRNTIFNIDDMLLIEDIKNQFALLDVSTIFNPLSYLL